MSKEEKRNNLIPDGMKCYQKNGGGSFRFKNRIIKAGQHFWIHPEAIPQTFAKSFEEIPADYKAVIINSDTVVKVAKPAKAVSGKPKFEVLPAVDEDGNTLKKGKDDLYNVIDETGAILNEKPLRKGKAEEFASALNL